MMTKMTPMLAAWHWRFFGHGDRGALVVLFMAIAICALIIAWPGNSENKK